MTKNKKILFGIGAGVLIYWIYTRNKAGKSLNPFSSSSNFTGTWSTDFFQEGKKAFNDAGSFFNFTDTRDNKYNNFSAGCQVYQGSCNAPAGTFLDGNRVIVKSDKDSCVVCPRSNTATGMPVVA